MAALNHDFVLVARKEHHYSEYLNFTNDPTAIQIHDDLLGYMSDTLTWIPTFNPAKSEDCKGLCWYGPTVIKSNGAGIAAQLFRAWADLFSYGPKRFHLTGDWEQEEGRPFSEGEYEKITINRDDVVKRITALASLADRVSESNDELYILHLGI